MEYLVNPNHKFIITLKNPTDRAIAEYFYPYIRVSVDISTAVCRYLNTLQENNKPIIAMWASQLF